jgi:hypothetical protein
LIKRLVQTWAAVAPTKHSQMALSEIIRKLFRLLATR